MDIPTSYPPCPVVEAEGIGGREIRCEGVLIPFSGLLDDYSSNGNRILPVMKWACTKCNYIKRLNTPEYRMRL